MRKVVFGEPVKAEDVESLPADTGPSAFVRLCGLLVGQALAERFGRSVVPQITERILVPDRAVDAEYTAPPIEEGTEAYGLIGPGRTVFQFKYRDFRARGRASAVSDLLGKLRKDFAHGGPVCDRYVLMTNLHLAGAQPHRLRAQLESVAALTGKPIVIRGAAEIALSINRSPHLRHLFFSTGGFCTLDVAEAELRAAYATVGWPSFVGRARERAAIEEFLNDKDARVMQVIGPPYVGKTRLVIEALKPYGACVLWCSHADELSLDHFRDLDTPEESTILVIDRYEPRSAPQILEAARERRRLKTLLISKGSFSDTGPAKLLVAPFEHEDTGKLVHELFPKAPWLEQSWLRESTGGLPGLILHVAGLLNEARISPSSPSEEVQRRIGELVEEKYLIPLDPDGRRALSVAALLPVLGVEGEPGTETDAISRALGLDPAAFRSRLPELESLGLIRRRGRFLEVIPPRLADHLASRALGKPEDVLAELRVALDEGAFRRLLSRFSNLPNPEARQAIDHALSAGGWFPDLPTLANTAKHLEILAPAAPSSALRCLERLLDPLQPADLQNEIKDDARRSVVWTLEKLALRSATFVGSARLLLALAEQENETWSNDATGIFVELFHWRHPEVSAPLGHRSEVLRKGAAAASARRRMLVARACGAAFDNFAVSLHHAERGDLPEAPYRPGTWEEVCEYGSSILDLLVPLLDDYDPATREAAFDAVLTCFRPFVTASLLARGLSQLDGRALTEIERLGRSAPTARRRARVVTELEVLADDLAKNPAHFPGLTEVLERTNRILEDLTEGSLRARIWRWAGPRSWKLQLLEVENSGQIKKAVDTLALHLASHPQAFEEHLEWLTEGDAERSWGLFFALGREDHDRRLLQNLLRHHDQSERAQAFSAYIAGWSIAARAEADSLLDDLAKSRPDLAIGVLRATACLTPSSSGVERILALLKNRAIPRQDAARELASLQWENLPPEHFQRLIQGLDGGTPETRALLLWPFLRCLARDVPLIPEARDLAWSFLQSTLAEQDARHGHDWDFLAAKLGKTEPERLLTLVESLTALDRKRWQSLSLEGELPLVWRTLTTHNRQGLVRMLLRAEMACEPPPWVGWELAQTLHPDEDADLLLAFAREHGVEAARVVASVLDASKAGFWDTTRRLLSEWGDDERVRDRLLSQVASGTWAGSAVPMLTERLQAARHLRGDPNTRVAGWAQDAAEFLEEWRRRADRDDQEEWIWDYRIRRAELEQMVHSPDSPQRLWAIGRLLKHAPPERVRELLAPEDILEALPKLIELDERTRRKWAAYARHLVER